MDYDEIEALVGGILHVTTCHIKPMMVLIFENQNGQSSGEIQPSAIRGMPDNSISFLPVLPSGPILSIV
jgi:hypothetical protein